MGDVTPAGSQKADRKAAAAAADDSKMFRQTEFGRRRSRSLLSKIRGLVRWVIPSRKPPDQE